MSRTLKVRTVTKYLTGRTGIPSLYYDRTTGNVQSPPPYRFGVSTDAAWWRLGKYLKEMPEDSLSFAIRYDKYIEGGVDNAIVAMRLEVFVKLLEAHYNTIEDRIKTFTEGE